MTPDCACNTTGLAFNATQEFLVTYCITFVYFLLCVVPFRVQLVKTLCKIFCLDIFTGIFMKIFGVWNIILGLYSVACCPTKTPIRGLASTIGEYRKKFEISQGLHRSPRTDLENLPETPNDSGPTFSHR